MASDQGVQTSTIGSRWIRKIGFFLLLLLGLGIWASWDAFHVYPIRGRAYAEWAEQQYLTLVKEEARGGRGSLELDAPVQDPVAEYRRLQQDEASRAAKPSMTARYEWLKALSLVGELKPEVTNFKAYDGASKREAQLTLALAGRDQPAPLHGYDIPSQYLLMIIGYGLGLYILFLIGRVAMTKYRWDPTTRTLTLPSGASITPADLEEVDKRKWDKFIVFLRVKQGVGGVGGSSIRVDTYRHAFVEDWILEMEREAFGSQEDVPGGDPSRPDTSEAGEPDASDEADAGAMRAT